MQIELAFCLPVCKSYDILCDPGVVYKGLGALKERHAYYACRPSVREQQISKRDKVRDLYGDKKRTEGGINTEYVRGPYELIVFQHVKKCVTFNVPQQKDSDPTYIQYIKHSRGTCNHESRLEAC